MSLTGIGRLRPGGSDVVPPMLSPGELVLQGRIKPIRPMGEPAAAAKCAYCGRYGALGQCAGCGAPNEPAPRALPRTGGNLGWEPR